MRCRGGIGVSCCRCHGQLLDLVAPQPATLFSTFSHWLSEYGNGEHYGSYLVKVPLDSSMAGPFWIEAVTHTLDLLMEGVENHLYHYTH